MHGGASATRAPEKAGSNHHKPPKTQISCSFRLRNGGMQRAIPKFRLQRVFLTWETVCSRPIPLRTASSDSRQLFLVSCGLQEALAELFAGGLRIACHELCGGNDVGDGRVPAGPVTSVGCGPARRISPAWTTADSSAGPRQNRLRNCIFSGIRTDTGDGAHVGSRLADRSATVP